MKKFQPKFNSTKQLLELFTPSVSCEQSKTWIQDRIQRVLFGSFEELSRPNAFLASLYALYVLDEDPIQLRESYPDLDLRLMHALNAAGKKGAALEVVIALERSDNGEIIHTILEEFEQYFHSQQPLATGSSAVSVSMELNPPSPLGDGANNGIVLKNAAWTIDLCPVAMKLPGKKTDAATQVSMHYLSASSISRPDEASLMNENKIYVREVQWQDEDGMCRLVFHRILQDKIVAAGWNRSAGFLKVFDVDSLVCVKDIRTDRGIVLMDCDDAAGILLSTDTTDTVYRWNSADWTYREIALDWDAVGGMRLKGSELITTDGFNSTKKWIWSDEHSDDEDDDDDANDSLDDGVGDSVDDGNDDYDGYEFKLRWEAPPPSSLDLGIVDFDEDYVICYDMYLTKILDSTDGSVIHSLDGHLLGVCHGLLVMREKKGLSVWSPESGECLKRFRTGTYVSAFAASHKFVALGHLDGTITMFNPEAFLRYESGASIAGLCLKTYRNPTSGNITSLQIQGEWLISCDMNNKVCVWKLFETPSSLC